MRPPPADNPTGFWHIPGGIWRVYEIQIIETWSDKNLSAVALYILELTENVLSNYNAWLELTVA